MKPCSCFSKTKFNRYKKNHFLYHKNLSSPTLFVIKQVTFVHKSRLLKIKFFMGITCSCPFSESNDLESGYESIIERYISFGDDEANTTTKENETKISNVAAPASPVMDPDNNVKHQAAVTLQKVYRSFRVRRQLADCAVQLVEQHWWRLIEYAELSASVAESKNQQETTISKWARAKIRGAKIGKGLSKNGNAQKLDIRHWLEAIDPRHRYGHNLQFYYVKWLNCQSKQGFFYWLNIGEGKEVDLVDKCPRSKLQQQCIKYLGPSERKKYQVVVENGKLVFMQTGKLVDTTGGSTDDKWIFVLCTSNILYIAQKNKGTFQHSSFLAGAATMSAGRLVAEKGVLKAVWPHSGHYLPTGKNFKDFESFLRENKLDLSEVQMIPVHDEDQFLNNQPRKDEEIQVLHAEEASVDESAFDSEDEEYLTPKMNFFDEEQNITEESKLEEIESFKKSNSYKLGKQLSRTWSSGTGTRIGCIGEYPAELRIRALEHAKLSSK